MIPICNYGGNSFSSKIEHNPAASSFLTRKTFMQKALSINRPQTIYPKS
jgi:hypothetical protein